MIASVPEAQGYSDLAVSCRPAPRSRFCLHERVTDVTTQHAIHAALDGQRRHWTGRTGGRP